MEKFMEKFFVLFKFGLKYLYRYRRRYAFLLAALVVSFAVVTIITSQKDGMYENVYYTAQSHYAGDIIAYAADSEYGNRMGKKEKDIILNAAASSGMNPIYIVERTMYMDGAVVFFNGAGIQLKYLMGSNWEEEEHLFGEMSFIDAAYSFPGDDGIILSVPTANQMGARIGDSVILEVDTVDRQKNTGVFIVKGIVQDTSIFGYFKAYVSRVSLNRLLLFSDDDCSVIGFFLDNPNDVEQKRVNLYKAISDKLQISPLVYSRSEMDRARKESFEGVKIFLYTLQIYLTEVADLLNAMNILTYFLYIMMLLIIMVSAATTYRLLLHERTREMGIMRTIGFYGGDLRIILWAEIIALALVSLLAGFILAVIVSSLLSFISFSWFPSFEIFMKNGRLTALYLPKTMLINVASVFIILFMVTIHPLFLASRKKLPDLLSGEPL